MDFVANSVRNVQKKNLTKKKRKRQGDVVERPDKRFRLAEPSIPEADMQLEPSKGFAAAIATILDKEVKEEVHFLTLTSKN